MYCLIYIQNKSPSFNLSNDAFNINWGFSIGSHEYDLDVAGTATSVTCVVTVSDGDLTDNATLIITINDVNDHTPIMGSSSYTFYASPGTGVGTVIGQISATDGDMGSFGKNNFNMYIGVHFSDIPYCFLLNTYEMTV